MTLADLFLSLQTSERGLSSSEAEKRLHKYGLNSLPEPEEEGIAILFLRQFRSPLIYILLVAAVVVFSIGETVDGAVICVVLVFNAVVGTIQEGRAQKTLHALSAFTRAMATVLRDGNEIITKDADVVSGDIIVLREGEKVPADARLIFSENLRTDEASLTGESEPIDKDANAGDIADNRKRLPEYVYKGTHVVAGYGIAVVTATGLDTEMGSIAREITKIKSEVPLQANIRSLSKIIIAAVAVISIIIFTSGLLSGEPAIDMFATVVSLAVSVIPEGLPIVVTLILAAGVWRMSKRNALVKNLQAVEALGQARVIAVDKTGTITKNELVIQKVYAGGRVFDISGIGYANEGEATLEGVPVYPSSFPDLVAVGRAAALCSNARVMYSEEIGEWRIGGDPTEAAIVVLGRKLGFSKDALLEKSPLLAELPFTHQLKFHATLHRMPDHLLLTVIGTPESVLEASDYFIQDGVPRPLTKSVRNDFENVLANFSRDGLRVVAAAARRADRDSLMPRDVRGMSLISLFGMRDALRAEAGDAIRAARKSGVRVVMITGDHRLTAEAIARAAGLYREGDAILTGEDVDELSDVELATAVGTVSVFARVTPEHKLRIINAYKARDEIIAMTGDGVNDAPSLVAADLGVAMGKQGTEVAKEAADIVLLDDNFGSIVAAIEEGRAIYRTIKKVILYLFSTSVGEVMAISGALAIGLPLPVLPVQIIWLNFVTDGFLDVALAMEPRESGLLSRSFKKPTKYLVDSRMTMRMILMGIVIATGSLFLFGHYLGDGMVKAWTISLTTLAVFQWFNAWNCRSETKSIFTINPFSNRYLVGATIVVIALQLLAVYAPFMQSFLRIVPLSVSEWVTIVAVAFSVVVVEEIRKTINRRRARRPLPA